MTRPRAREFLAGLSLVCLALLAGCAGTPHGADVAGADGKPVDIVPDAAVDTEERRRARIRMELAANHYRQRNYQTALEELRTALQIDADYSAAYGMLGLIYMDLGDNLRAESSFKRALELSPGNPDLNNNYGWFLCQTGREREAVTLFERAAADRLYPVPAKPLHNAGVCLRKIGDEKGAEQFLQRAFRIDPSNPVAMYNLGEIYLGRADLERARFYAQRLVTNLDPAPQTLWLALRVERALGNRDAVLSLGTQLRRRFPGSREAELLREGKFDE
ncbi:MAG: type IV pilus biogenesis/stability protein PilW [Burkholderiaceae bacterium]